MDWIIVIPVRLKSTRLKEKALIKIQGKSIIERTYNCALQATKDRNKIIIATDSERIFDHVKKFDARVEMTSENCLTGTDRVYEISKKYYAKQYINLQGDEPLFPISSIKSFIKESQKDISLVHTAVKRITNKDDYFNNSIPKMVFSKTGRLMFSSRAPIPFNKKKIFVEAFKHVCIYAYNQEHLSNFRNSKKSFFEKIEDLEINRYLENNIVVNCVEVFESGIAVDTEIDLINVKKNLLNEN